MNSLFQLPIAQRILHMCLMTTKDTMTGMQHQVWWCSTQVWNTGKHSGAFEGLRTNYLGMILLKRCERPGSGFLSTGKTVMYSRCQANKRWSVESIENCAGNHPITFELKNVDISTQCPILNSLALFESTSKAPSRCGSVLPCWEDQVQMSTRFEVWEIWISIFLFELHSYSSLGPPHCWEMQRYVMIMSLKEWSSSLLPNCCSPFMQGTTSRVTVWYWLWVAKRGQVWRCPCLLQMPLQNSHLGRAARW